MRSEVARGGAGAGEWLSQPGGWVSGAGGERHGLCHLLPWATKWR